MVEESDSIQTETAEMSAPDTATEQIETPEDDGPSVDALAGRLTDLQAAMDQLQAGDLDGAEATIASLEQALDDARQELGLT